MSALVVAALSAGLLGSGHCVGMCGPFLAAARRPTEGLAWHLGRVTAYLAMGAAAGGAAGLAGVWSTLPSWLIPAVSAVFLLYFSARLGGFLPAPARSASAGAPFVARVGASLLRRDALGARFLFGGMAGLLPCGLLWSALALAVATGAASDGAMVMGAFAAGTLPALAVAATAVRRLAAARPWVRRVVAAGVLLGGWWSIGVRAASADAPACHMEP